MICIAGTLDHNVAAQCVHHPDWIECAETVVHLDLIQCDNVSGNGCGLTGSNCTRER